MTAWLHTAATDMAECECNIAVGVGASLKHGKNLCGIGLLTFINPQRERAESHQHLTQLQRQHLVYHDIVRSQFIPISRKNKT